MKYIALYFILIFLVIVLTNVYISSTRKCGVPILMENGLIVWKMQ